MNKIIKTNRLLLRPIKIDDLQIIQNYSIDPEWNRFLDFHTKESVKEFVLKAVYSDWLDIARFTITLNNEVIGGIGLDINQKEKRAELGYSLSKRYWGLGIIPEAAKEVVNYGFNILNIEKIYAQTDLRNLPSQSVMKKLQMNKEGVFRKHVIYKNIRRDVVFYSILKADWETSNYYKLPL